MIVEVEGLRKAFGSTPVLTGVDFAVPEGSVLGILGPNGAGKTTTVRILTTLLRPDGGTVRSPGTTSSASPGRSGPRSASPASPRRSTAARPAGRTW